MTESRKRLFSLIDDVLESHEPIEIQSKRSSAMLLSEQEWSALQETLSIVSLTSMRDSIVEVMATPGDAMREEPG